MQVRTHAIGAYEDTIQRRGNANEKQTNRGLPHDAWEHVNDSPIVGEETILVFEQDYVHSRADKAYDSVDLYHQRNRSFHSCIISLFQVLMQYRLSS